MQTYVPKDKISDYFRANPGSIEFYFKIINLIKKDGKCYSPKNHYYVRKLPRCDNIELTVNGCFLHVKEQLTKFTEFVAYKRGKCCTNNADGSLRFLHYFGFRLSTGKRFTVIVLEIYTIPKITFPG